LVPDVEEDRVQLGARALLELALHFGEAIGAPAREHEVLTLAGEAPCAGGPNPGRGAGNENSRVGHDSPFIVTMIQYVTACPLCGSGAWSCYPFRGAVWLL